MIGYQDRNPNNGCQATGFIYESFLQLKIYVAKHLSQSDEQITAEAHVRPYRNYLNFFFLICNFIISTKVNEMLHVRSLFAPIVVETDSNSFAPGRFENNFRQVIFMLISVTDG